MQITAKSHILKKVPDVLSICQPLFKASNINYFHYVRLYKDGSVLDLSTNSGWACYFYEKEFFRSYHPDFREGHFLRSLDPKHEEETRAASEMFNIWHMFDIVRDIKDYYEIVGFGCSEHHASNVADYYFNNLSELNRFIFYFRDKGRKLIEKADRLQLPADLQIRKHPEEIQLDLHLPIHRVFLDKLGVVLTKRELQTLVTLMHGHSAKSASVLLGLSSKTIEHHTAGLKRKLGCDNRAELIKHIYTLGLVDIMMRVPLEIGPIPRD